MVDVHGIQTFFVSPPYWSLEAECDLLMFLWSLGPLVVSTLYSLDFLVYGAAMEMKIWVAVQEFKFSCHDLETLLLESPILVAELKFRNSNPVISTIRIPGLAPQA